MHSGNLRWRSSIDSVADGNQLPLALRDYCPDCVGDAPASSRKGVHLPLSPKRDHVPRSVKIDLMVQAQRTTNWKTKLRVIPQFSTIGNLALAFGSVLDVWELVGLLRDKIGYHGMYEILAYDATLEIRDARGHEASLVRHEVIRFLQDNVVAIHDHAWGDGELFTEYHCQPGIPVDFYEDGSKHNVLISLRETKNRGDVIDLWIERVISEGLRQKDEWLETEIDHRMKYLKLSIIFPRDRRCQRAILTRRSTNQTTILEGRHFSTLSDGRQQLTWETNRPKLHDIYTIKWRW